MCVSLDPLYNFFYSFLFSLFYRPLPTGGVSGKLVSRFFLKISLETVYSTYKNVSKCTEMYGSVRKRLGLTLADWKTRFSCDTANACGPYSASSPAYRRGGLSPTIISECVDAS